MTPHDDVPWGVEIWHFSIPFEIKWFHQIKLGVLTGFAMYGGWQSEKSKILNI